MSFILSNLSNKLFPPTFPGAVSLMVSHVFLFIGSIFLLDVLFPKHFLNDIYSCLSFTINDIYRHTMIAMLSGYYIPSLICCFVDRYYIHQRIRNPGHKRLLKIPWNEVQRASKLSFFGQSLFVFYQVFINILVLKWRGICDDNEYSYFLTRRPSFLSIVSLMFEVDDGWDWHWFPNAIQIIILFLCFIVLASLIFYCSHRLFHMIPFLYKLHKVHHTFVDSFGIVTAASNLVEHMLLALPTIIIPFDIFGIPLGLQAFLMFVSAISGVMSHSGYAVTLFQPLFGSVGGGIPHDFHHHYHNCEYGSLFWDDVFGTTIADMYPKKWEEIQAANKYLNGSASSVVGNDKDR